MQIFATFEYTSFLELAISELEQRGITDIYAVPLDLRKEEGRIMDTIHRADGISLMDKGMVLAFMLGTIGASKGFVWEWGPIVWGLIGAGSGFVLGVLISCIQYLRRQRKHRRKASKGVRSEVILIITCEEGQAPQVEDVLWQHMALGMAKTRA